MTAPVNLINLREMTDGDKDLEESLFLEFFSSSEKLLDQLTQALTADDGETWRTSAHALKGTSYNLGAQQLGDYCKKAQEGHSESSQEKAPLLQLITSEYVLVKEFLQKEMTA